MEEKHDSSNISCLALRGKATIVPPDFKEAHFDMQGKYAHKGNLHAYFLKHCI